MTDYGLGPDKWATAWLLTQQAMPEAQLQIVEAGQPLPAGTHFDVIGSPIRRQGERAAFQVAREAYQLNDPDVARLAQIVHDIEIDFWHAERDPASPLIEQGFRALQQRYGRERVPASCYLSFFSSVHAAIRTERMTRQPIDAEALSIDCNLAELTQSDNVLVPEVALRDLLAEMRRGKSVVFVDVREPDEFAEAHVPGARNIQLRGVSAAVVEELQSADYVVSYCVKDFRGFEMAKALRDAGVRRSIILNPYGIKGWVASGLPTAGARAMSESEAEQALTACIVSPEQCLARPAVSGVPRQ